MRIRIFVLLAILFFWMQAFAQECWLQPEKFVGSGGENLKVVLLSGKEFKGSPWSIAVPEINKLDLHHLNNIFNLKTQFGERTKDTLVIKLAEPGTQLISLETNPKTRQREASEFNESLKTDGLDNTFYDRERHHELDKPVRELFSLYTKLLVQVNEHRDETYRKILGLPLEILVDRNPYNLKVGDPIHFKILFQGKPLFGAKVRIWNYYNNLTTTQNIFTLQDGTMETHISNAGIWLVSVVNMVRSKSSEADWESFRSSLTFGIGQ